VVSKLKLEKYYKLVRNKKCVMCKRPLPRIILHYPHPNGWKVEGYSKPQWLYIECLYCGYQNALWKLGVNEGRVI